MKKRKTKRKTLKKRNFFSRKRKKSQKKTQKKSQKKTQKKRKKLRSGKGKKNWFRRNPRLTALGGLVALGGLAYGGHELYDYLNGPSDSDTWAANASASWGPQQTGPEHCPAPLFYGLDQN